jgi:hypothetical protein
MRDERISTASHRHPDHSLPAAMAEQMKKVQKKENRTRSELAREAWRQCFENHLRQSYADQIRFIGDP